jgi:iron complex outermembrane receptor protein
MKLTNYPSARALALSATALSLGFAAPAYAQDATQETPAASPKSW